MYSYIRDKITRYFVRLIDPKGSKDWRLQRGQSFLTVFDYGRRFRIAYTRPEVNDTWRFQGVEDYEKVNFFSTVSNSRNSLTRFVSPFPVQPVHQEETSQLVTQIANPGCEEVFGYQAKRDSCMKPTIDDEIAFMSCRRGANFSARSWPI